MTTTCRLATIFNADVVGYSHLMGADEQSTLILAAIHRLATDRPSFSGLITAGEEGMLRRLKAHRREIVDPKITEHRGRILKTTSDGMIVEFTNPVEAVRCAVEMQQSMAERNARTAADKRLTFRIAIDLGNVATDEAVSISTRLRALAEPGLGANIAGTAFHRGPAPSRTSRISEIFVIARKMANRGSAGGVGG